MRRTFVQVLVAACAVLSLIPSSAAEPSSWVEIRSAHYTVITDAGEKKGREVAVRFEQMRAIFGTLLMRDRINEPAPMTILAFKNDKNYYQTAPLRRGQPIAVPGFFLPGEDQNFVVLNLFEEESWRAVAHNFAHLLLNYNYPPVQGWFDEGMAEYFSSIRLDDKHYEIGSDPELQSIYKQDLLENEQEVHNPPKSLTELLSGQVWLAVPDLFTMKHDTSGSYAEATHHTLFYAQSWMTIHYLINKKLMPETGTYFDLVENQGVPVTDAIQQAYGMSANEFDAAVKTYFHSLTQLFVALDASKQPDSVNKPPLPQVYSFPQIVGPNDSQITVTPLSEADARAMVAAVKLRIPDRREAGLNELQTLATTEPAPVKSSIWEKKDKSDKKDNKDDHNPAVLVGGTGNEIAHRMLAWDHVEHSEFDAAGDEISKAAALNSHDIWIRFYLSVLKYRIAQSHHTDITGLPNEIQDLRAVVEWYPEFAEAYDTLATAQREGGGPTAAMQSERAAMQLAPRNQEYVLHLAEIYIADRRWQAALLVLDRLKKSDNAQISALARERMDQIPKEQKYGMSPESIAAAEKLQPQKSPFDVLEEDAAKRAAAAKAQSGSTADTRPAKFLQGELVKVDCSQAPVALLTVSSGSTTLKLRTADYKSLLLIGADGFSCDWSNRAVSVNYKAGGVADGDLVSVEMR